MCARLQHAGGMAGHSGRLVCAVRRRRCHRRRHRQQQQAAHRLPGHGKQAATRVGLEEREFAQGERRRQAAFWASKGEAGGALRYEQRLIRSYFAPFAGLQKMQAGGAAREPQFRPSTSLVHEPSARRSKPTSPAAMALGLTLPRALPQRAAHPLPKPLPGCALRRRAAVLAPPRASAGEPFDLAAYTEAVVSE